MAKIGLQTKGDRANEQCNCPNWSIWSCSPLRDPCTWGTGA